MGLFSKKNCAFCGGDIGLFGNTKLEDGNMCKNCVAKVSPFLKGYNKFTVEQMEDHLRYREDNQEKVESFHTTRSLGMGRTKLLLDEDNRKFMVTSASVLSQANPDVMDFADVTGCEVEVEDSQTEIRTKDAEGKMISYEPKRYKYDYDFNIVINVNHPYFNTIKFQFNNDSVELESIVTQDPNARRPIMTPPSRPVSTPARPAAAAPTRAAVSTPARPAAGTPARPGVSTPARPAAGTPARPVVSTPARPAAGTPARPGVSTPARPAAGTPARPGAGTPARPAAGTPARPAASTPARPAAAAPARPAAPQVNPGYGTIVTKPDPTTNREYIEYQRQGAEIREILMNARMEAREAGPKVAVTCPWCGATSIPDEQGCCEYCGGSLLG